MDLEVCNGNGRSLEKSVIVGKFREEAGEMQFMREDMD